MLRKPIIKPRRFGDITKLAKEMGVNRGTVSEALMGIRHTQLSDDIRDKMLKEPYYGVLIK